MAVQVFKSDTVVRSSINIKFRCFLILNFNPDLALGIAEFNCVRNDVVQNAFVHTPVKTKFSTLFHAFKNFVLKSDVSVRNHLFKRKHELHNLVPERQITKLELVEISILEL